MNDHHFRVSPFYRLVACLLLVLQAVVGWPMVVMAQLPEGGGQPEGRVPDFSKEERIGTRSYPANVSAKKGKDQGITEIKLKLSAEPTDIEIQMARVFEEPLIPLEGQSGEEENKALGAALKAYKVRTNKDDVSALDGFLASYPDSRWKAGLQTNLGIVRRKAGYFTEAMARLEEAWALGKSATEPQAHAQANRAVAELADINARFGRFNRMKEIFDETNSRGITGSPAAMINGAKEGYWMMTKRPELGFRCGPFAVNAVLDAGKQLVPNAEVAKLGSTQQGTNLQQLEELAGKVGMNFLAARKGANAEWQVPMVVHWKVGHFAAITKKVKDRYLIKDPTFGGEIWVTKEALDNEGTGYGLVSAAEGGIPEGWATVSEEEAREVWGKGGATSREDGNCPETTGGCCGAGMAYYNILKMRGTLSLTDQPVGYNPPVGPAVWTTVRYKHLETGQPANFTFMNFGPYWECNWVGYVEVDSGGTVVLQARGGGTEVFNFSDYNAVTGQFKRALSTGAIMKKKGDQRYERVMPSGAREVYSQPDNAGRIFLKEHIDSRGNKLTFNYDANVRLTSIVDAIGQSTTITYQTNTPGSGAFYRVSRITDPFGRYAEFTYFVDKLIKITDVIGIESSFTYAEGGFIERLTTPYGNTDFYQYVPAEDGTARGLLVILPDGSRECLESYADRHKTTYFWDRKAMAMAPGDRSKSEQTRWLMSYEGNVMMDVAQWRKKALEGKVEYEYPNQPLPNGMPNPEDDPENPETMHNYTGDLRSPSKVIRKLDDNTDQISSFEYNGLGKVTKSVDPLGRAFRFMYAANNIDLMEVRQVRGENNDLLAKFTYNNQHLPLTARGASGRTSTFTYNSRGQTTSVTNPKGEVKTITYDADGYLTQINGALSGNNDRVDVAYDDYGRRESITIPQGPTSGTDNYTLTYSYDALNRLTEVEYPDGSTEENVYSRLDTVRTKDRLGRWTQYVHDALGQVVETRDPSGRITRYEWCRCGALQGLTDPAGNVTKWTYDVQGRLTKKTYADSSHEDYEYETNLSRIKSITDTAGNLTEYAYNIDNTLAQVECTPVSGFADVPDVALTWDEDYLRLTGVNDSQGSFAWEYGDYASDFYGAANDSRGKLVAFENRSPANALLSEITYEYDELGRVVKSQIDGAANESTWAYDAAGRVSAWANELGAFTPTYVNPSYGVGRISSVEYPNGQTVNFDYEDNTGDFRLKEIENLGDGGTALSKFNYVTDVIGRIQQWKQQEGDEAAQRYDIGYNAVDEVVSAVLKTDSSNAIVQEFYYGFDVAGNRTNEQVDGVVRSSSYNDVNQLIGSTAGGKTRFRGKINEPGTVKVNGQSAWMTSGTNFQTDATLTTGTNTVTVEAKDASSNTRTNTYQVIVPGGASKTLTYDANGNMLSDGDKTYAWDAGNRMVKITYPDSSWTEFTYDALGRRVKVVEKDSGGTIVSSKRFVWEGMGIAEERDDSNQVVKRFYGEGMQYDEVNYFYTRDHLGSVRELTDSNSTVRAAYSYDPYGRQETALPAGMKLWLKADAGVTKDGSNKVSGWADQSGNGSNAAQATSAAQPTWVDNAANGEPVIRFGGTDDVLVGSVNFSVASSDHTMFAVHKRTTPSQGSAPFSFAESLSPIDYGASLMSWINNTDNFGTTNTGYGWSDAKYVDLSAEASSLHLSMISRKGGTNGNGGALTIRSVADQDLKQTTATQTWTSLSANNRYLVGCHNPDTGYGHFLIGDVAEVIVYDRNLSPSERTRVEAYLGRKYDRNVVQSDFRYTGHYFHEKSGLSLAPFRAYDAELARWTSRDPIGEAGGMNLYEYCLGDPINLLDPTGNAPVAGGGTAAGAALWDYLMNGDPTTDPIPDVADCPPPGGGGGPTEADLDDLQTALDLAGLMDGPWGLGADLLNAGISLARGRPGDAAISVAAAIPLVGILVGGMKLKKASLAAHKKALKEVHRQVGKLPKGKPGKYGSPQAGDSKKGYRLDPAHPKARPGSPEDGPHINWWDYTGGKRGKGGRGGAVPIE